MKCMLAYLFDLLWERKRNWGGGEMKITEISWPFYLIVQNMGIASLLELYLMYKHIIYWYKRKKGQIYIKVYSNFSIL